MQKKTKSNTSLIHQPQSIVSSDEHHHHDHDRRDFLRNVGVSAALLPVLGGCHILDHFKPKDPDDTSLEDGEALNKALLAEYKIVAAYDAIINACVLNPASLELAKNFRDDHRRHITILRTTIKGLKVDPVPPPSPEEIAADSAKSIKDALSFLRDKEQEIALIYLNSIESIKKPATSKTAANIMGVETMHLAILRYWLGDKPVPSATVA